MESAMGVVAGHEQTVQLVEHYLEQLEGPRQLSALPIDSK
jgi:hypothetical protein